MQIQRTNQLVTSGWEEWGGAKTGDTVYKINKLQGYIAQQRKYSPYFIITIKEYNFKKL